MLQQQNTCHTFNRDNESKELERKRKKNTKNKKQKRKKKIVSKEAFNIKGYFGVCGNNINSSYSLTL